MRSTARVVLGCGVFLLGGLLAPAPAAAQTTAAARNVTLRLSHAPEGVTKYKGVLIFTVRGIASGWASGEPMKGLAKRLEAPIVMVSGGDDLNDNSYPNRCASGEFNGIGEALTKLGAAANHPELANAPLVTIGHSHGGDYWNWYNACHPEKVAVVFVHASGGVNYTGASLKTPVFYELGTGDLIENGSKKPRAGMFANRGKGAPMGLVIGQGEGHDQVTAASLGMIIDLIEATFKLRVPADADPAAGPVRLNEIDETTGNYWLGDLFSKEIAAYGSYTGNKALTSFLPNEEIAKKWKMTGPGLPASIMLPSGTCGWCGNPKDEPKATPGGPVAPPNNNSPSDAGSTAPADAGSGTTEPPPPPPPPPAVDAGTPVSDPPPVTPTPPPTKRDAGASASTPPNNTSTPSGGVQGGCSYTPAGGGSLLGLGLLVALLALIRRRR